MPPLFRQTFLRAHALVSVFTPVEIPVIKRAVITSDARLILVVHGYSVLYAIVSGNTTRV